MLHFADDIENGSIIFDLYPYFWFSPAALPRILVVFIRALYFSIARFRVRRCGASAFAAIMAMNSSSAMAQSLTAALTSAYSNNPALLAKRADVRAQDELYIQAIDAFGPSADVFFSEDANQSTVTQSNIFLLKNTSTYRAANPTMHLTLKQTLFSTGVNGAQLEYAAASVLAARQDLRNVESNLFNNVITAYLDIVRDEQILAIAHRSVDALVEQVDAVNAKFRVGAASIGDASQFAARLARARADVARAVTQLNTSRDEFFRNTSISPGELTQPEYTFYTPTSLEAVRLEALKNNALLRGDIYRLRAADAKVRFTRDLRGPTLGLRVSVDKAPLEPYQTDMATGVTAGVTLSMPLFSSGDASSKVREAIERDKAAAKTAADTRRSTLTEVEERWLQREQLNTTLSLSVEEAKEDELAYNSIYKQYKAGLASTLELLNAEQERDLAAVSLAQAKHDAWLSEINLLAVSGALEAKVLLPGVEIYSPEQYLNGFRMAMSPWAHLLKRIDDLGQRTPESAIGDPAGEAPIQASGPESTAVLSQTTKLSQPPLGDGR